MLSVWGSLRAEGRDSDRYRDGWGGAQWRPSERTGRARPEETVWLIGEPIDPQRGQSDDEEAMGFLDVQNIWGLPSLRVGSG